MLSKEYRAEQVEAELATRWEETGLYHFNLEGDSPVYSIDTPPPTVSGYLHLGHVYSYSQADFMARFFRMNGYNVFYPMGFDDNGLPTERLVQRQRGMRPEQVGRPAFIAMCLETSDQAAAEYKALWQRLGLSVDWRHTYRTIDEASRRISQWSFIDLYRKGLVYRQEAPSIWCPECRTAIAQAELDDQDRDSEMATLRFTLPDGCDLPVATTRAELLPACVALFVHPEDARFAAIQGAEVVTPLGEHVPVLASPLVDPSKGSGAVMCCTFGDQVDVTWWRVHHLPLRAVLGPDGRMTALATHLAGMTTRQARAAMLERLEDEGKLLSRSPLRQSVRVHERCGTPVEYLLTQQWFVKVLPYKDDLLALGDQLTWRPEHMRARYREWVENLHWDWCISRQRYYGVPFPLWTCAECGQVMLASEDDLPVDPTEHQPEKPCPCGSTHFIPESDVMDTWATSSMSPQIVGRWLDQPGLYDKITPFSLRPQAHEIIRTWAFYTLVKSYHHFGRIPWTDVGISGWGLAPGGTEKLSKSRANSLTSPHVMMDRYSADAARYWAASTPFGRDSVISEEKIQAGMRLVNKLWNVARFCERFELAGRQDHLPADATPADLWILSRAQRLIQAATAAYQAYDFAQAKNEVEAFFWTELADNYIEMAKQRLYDPAQAGHAAALFTLRHALLVVIKLLAPVMPYVTEAIYLGLFAEEEGQASLHRSSWPSAQQGWIDATAEMVGEALLQVATAARRYKSERKLSLGTELARIGLACGDYRVIFGLQAAENDLRSVTRAGWIEVDQRPDQIHGLVEISIEP